MPEGWLTQDLLGNVFALTTREVYVDGVYFDLVTVLDTVNLMTYQ